MKKLALRPEELRVESFPVAADAITERGTVRGNAAATRPTLMYQPGCWTSPEFGSTCEPVYTCPECASPPETMYTCGPTEPVTAPEA